MIIQKKLKAQGVGIIIHMNMKIKTVIWLGKVKLSINDRGQQITPIGGKCFHSPMIQCSKLGIYKVRRRVENGNESKEEMFHIFRPSAKKAVGNKTLPLEGAAKKAICSTELLILVQEGVGNVQRTQLKLWRILLFMDGEFQKVRWRGFRNGELIRVGKRTEDVRSYMKKRGIWGCPGSLIQCKYKKGKKAQWDWCWWFEGKQ